MRYGTKEIIVEGQQAGPAMLSEYILDPVSVAPDKRRPAVIVCPGGGYRFCSDREAEPVVMRFLAMGYHAFLFNYSVAPNRFPTALREIAGVVAYVREHSEEWLIDEKQIYVCGFSAAGHLAASLGVFWNREFVYGPIGKTPEQIRPDGLILAYPVITSGEFAHRGSFEKLLGENADEEALESVSLEKQVTSQVPRVFMWHTWEDSSVPVENSLLFATALKQHGVNFEMHIYPRGKHGSSLANDETSAEGSGHNIPEVQNWIDLAHTWIEGGRA